MRSKANPANRNFDVVVIGSGFGGAITACRLAQAGRSVCILEKGKRWKRNDFPRGPGEVSRHALADASKPGTQGFIEYRTFRNMDVIQGTGVGGGSLHYFNVHVQPPPFIFAQASWPEQINLELLAPYYKLAAQMLGANAIRATQERDIPCRTRVFEDAVQNLGLTASRVPICVRFEDQKTTDKSALPGCEHCGNCLLGCHVHAKNTLDLNYIPLAEEHGALVLAQHEAINIRPDAQGYSVTCTDHSSPPGDSPEEKLKILQAHQVVLAAGTLGTNQLLLRCKQKTRTLPRLSPQLGKRFSGNGDFLYAGTHYQRRIVEPGRGPSITTSVGFKNNQQYIFIEDLGYPDPFIWYFNQAIPTLGRFKRALRQARHYLGEALGVRHHFQMQELLEGGFMTNFLPYLGMGTDAADGVLSLDHTGRIKLHWSVRNSLPMFKDMIEHMKTLSEASGGRFINSALWRTPMLGLPLKKTLTAHPLGGCAMSDSPLTGVTNDCGEVWGYKGLYVADGALMPAAIGVNPSATISALAERVAFRMIYKRELKMDETDAAYSSTHQQKMKTTRTPKPPQTELTS